MCLDQKSQSAYKCASWGLNRAISDNPSTLQVFCRLNGVRPSIYLMSTGVKFAQEARIIVANPMVWDMLHLSWQTSMVKLSVVTPILATFQAVRFDDWFKFKSLKELRLSGPDSVRIFAEHFDSADTLELLTLSDGRSKDVSLFDTLFSCSKLRSLKLHTRVLAPSMSPLKPCNMPDLSQLTVCAELVRTHAREISCLVAACQHKEVDFTIIGITRGLNFICIRDLLTSEFVKRIGNIKFEYCIIFWNIFMSVQQELVQQSVDYAENTSVEVIVRRSRDISICVQLMTIHSTRVSYVDIVIAPVETLERFRLNSSWFLNFAVADATIRCNYRVTYDIKFQNNVSQSRMHVFASSVVASWSRALRTIRLVRNKLQQFIVKFTIQNGIQQRFFGDEQDIYETYPNASRDRFKLYLQSV